MSSARLPVFGARPATDSGRASRYVPKRERLERHAAAMRAASTSLRKREAARQAWAIRLASKAAWDKAAAIPTLGPRQDHWEAK